MLVDVWRPPVARVGTAVRVEALILAAIVAYLAANLPYLEAWPTAHNDEARELNAFWAAAGVDPAARWMDPEFGPDPLYKGGLQGLTVGLMLRVAGLGLFQGRLVSLLWGGLLLWFLFLLGRRLYGPLPALAAAVALAASRPFLVASHMVRPDIVLAAMLAAACYLGVVAVQERRPGIGLAAGLVLGLALDVHLNALAFMPLVGLVILADSPRFWRSRVAHGFLLGLALGALYYLLVRVIPDPGQFARSSSYWIGIDKRPPILSGDLQFMLTAELGRFASYTTEDRRLELAVIVAGLAWAAARALRRRRLDPLLLGLAAAFALFVTVVSSKSEFYLILFEPWLLLLAAGGLADLGSAARALRAPLLALGVAAAPLVVGYPDSFDDMATAASNFAERGYPALIAEIREVVPPGASIIGPPLYWIGLSDHPYTDYYVWERLRAERRERFADYVARRRPDVAILDAKSRHQVAINSPDFLERNAVLLKTVKHVGFDRVEIWKLS